MKKLIPLACLALAVGLTAALAAGGTTTHSQPLPRSYGSTAPYAPTVTASVAPSLAAARLATAKYVSDLGRAKKDGYRIITQMIPDMGYHFLNPKIAGFDVTRPAILVYEKRGSKWQLGALEWVFTSKPKTPPLPGARYGAFPAACHYADGTFIAEAFEKRCPKTNPASGATFGFWHPDLVTMHVWVWYPNPSGIFSGTNPLVAPFNKG